MPTWILLMEWASRFVLAVLAGLSIWSVAIMIERARIFRKIQNDSSYEKLKQWLEVKDFDSIRKWIPNNEGLYAGVVKVALNNTNSTEAVDRAVRSFLATKRIELEEGLTTLATLGSNAPFIGLFGTVLGIIQAFGALSTTGQNGAASSVMSGISEALFATAVGLFVAIPAVVAFNMFTRKIRTVLTECEALRDLYVAKHREV